MRNRKRHRFAQVDRDAAAVPVDRQARPDSTVVGAEELQPCARELYRYAFPLTGLNRLARLPDHDRSVLGSHRRVAGGRTREDHFQRARSVARTLDREGRAST